MNYEDKEFKTLEINGSFLEELHFQECVFYQCTVMSTTVKSCTFHNCTFHNCIIADIEFKYTDLTANQFYLCKIIGVDWKDLQKKNSVTPPFTLFEQCSLSYNIFYQMKLPKFDFKTSMLEGSTFEECNLEASNFRGCKLTTTVFKQNNLSKSDFREAVGYLINIKENKLKAARFSYPDALGLLTGIGIIVD